MAKKLQRKFRGKKLSREEVAHDEEIRGRVRGEVPPAKSSPMTSPGSLTEALRQAIRQSEQSEYQIARDAGVSQIVISRFLSGERDIRMATADKLAEVLGLKLLAGT